MTYPRTFYTTRCLDAWQAGRCLGPIIIIRPKYKDDVGLYKHELEHIKQGFRTLGLHAILYNISDRYAMWAEAKAYAEQMKWPDRFGNKMTIEDAANRLASREYGFGLTIEEAKWKLMQMM